jgi:hypothetical protein
MAEFIFQPPFVALSESPIEVGVGTSYVNPVYAKAVLVFTAANIPNDSWFQIAWGGRKEKITFKTNPDTNNANEVATPWGGIDFTQGYFDYLLDVLRSNDRLAQDFQITCAFTAGAKMRLEFRAWNYDPLSIFITQQTPPIAGLTATVTNSPGPFLKPNLTALLTVNQDGSNKDLLRLTQPYQVVPFTFVNKGQSTFDIKAAFNLEPHLPEDFSIDRGFAYKSFTRYVMRLGDRYGTPPVAEKMTPSSMFNVIFGYKNEVDFVANDAGFYLCHPAIVAPITTEQPAWLYFFSSPEYSEGNRIYVNIKLNNTSEIEYIVGSEFNIQANTLFYQRADYQYLDIKGFCTSLNINPKSVIGYDIRVKSSSGALKVSRSFSIQECEGKALTLAYSNGIGGIDTLVMHPKHTRKVEVERQVVKLAGSNQERSFKAEAKKTWELHTPLIPTATAERLAQMLLGQVWIMDKAANSFVSIVADTKSVEIKPEKFGLTQLFITFKSSRIFKKI